MWYLITFEDHEFTCIVTKQDDTEFKYEGHEDKKPVFSVTGGLRQYVIEVLNDEPESGLYLTAFSELGSSHFIVLNHCTVLIKWDKGVEILIDKVMDVLNRKDKFAIFPITEVVASNMLDVKFINKIFKCG